MKSYTHIYHQAKKGKHLHDKTSKKTVNMPLPQKNRVTIIPLIILFLAALLFVPFARQLAKDKIELANNPIIEKFELLLNSKIHLGVYLFQVDVI